MPRSVREPLAELVLRGLDVRVEDRDGDLVLVLDDGEVLVTLEQGAGGRYDQAIEGLDRLALAASALAEQLREVRGAHV